MTPFICRHSRLYVVSPLFVHVWNINKDVFYFELKMHDGCCRGLTKNESSCGKPFTSVIIEGNYYSH